MGHTEAHTQEEMEYERRLAGATHQRAVADDPTLRPSGSEMEKWYTPTTPFGRTATGAPRTRAQREAVVAAQMLAGGGGGGNILEFLPRTNLAKGGQVIDLSGLLPGEMQSIFGATPEETLARGPGLSRQLQRGIARQQRFAQFAPTFPTTFAPTFPFQVAAGPRLEPGEFDALVAELQGEGMTLQDAIAAARSELGLPDPVIPVSLPGGWGTSPDLQALEFARYQAGARGVPAVTGPGGQPVAFGPEGLPLGFFGPPGVTPDGVQGAGAAPGVAPVETAADGRPVAPAAAKVPWAQRNDLFELFSGEEIGATGSETGTIKDLRAEGLSAAGRAGTLSDTVILKASAWLRNLKTKYQKKDEEITQLRNKLETIVRRLKEAPSDLYGEELEAHRAPLIEERSKIEMSIETKELAATREQNRYNALLQVLTGAEADQKAFEADLKTRQTEWDSAQDALEAEATLAEQQAARLAVFNEVIREVYTGLSPDVFSSLAHATQTALMASARREVLAREKAVAKTDPNAWRADALVELGKLFPEVEVGPAIFDLQTGLLNFFQGREVTDPPDTGTRPLTTVFA